MKEICSKDEDIGIRKCRIRSRVEMMNKELKGWTSSSKKEAPLEIPNTK